MRITILTMGSRGDVQPFLALGVGLQHAGYAVTLAAPALFEGLVRDYGLKFAPVRFSPREFIQLPEVQELQKNTLRRLIHGQRMLRPIFERMFDDFWQASQEADALLYYPGAPGTQVGYDCAEKLGLPLLAGNLQPSIPTRAFPNFYMPHWPHLGGTYNRLSHLAYEQILWQNIRGWLTSWRKRVLGLPPLPLSGPLARLRAQRVPYMFGYSPFVIPKPPDWEPWHHVTGYWFLDAPTAWQPPPALVQFLKAGPPPIFVGFGSSLLDDPQGITRLTLEALRRTGQRGILLSGWGNLGDADLPETVFRIDEVPQDWLFPQVAAVVHHAGAGTTSAGFKAGVPSIAIPFWEDQFDWARIVVKQGVGPQMGIFNRLTVEELAAAIDTVLSDRAMQARAAALGAQIRAEDGVTRAVEVVNNYLHAS